MYTKTLTLVAAAAALSVLPYTASAEDSMKAPIMAGGDAMMVDASSGSLTVDSIEAPSDGFIVVHKVADGKPGMVIGHAPVKKGENTDIQVDLDEDVPADSKLVLMLHNDTGEKGAYEFGMEGKNADAPVMADGKPVTEMVTVK